MITVSKIMTNAVRHFMGTVHAVKGRNGGKE